jgi:hypothetical protein
MKRAGIAGAGLALACLGIGGWWMVAHASERPGAVERTRINPDTMRLVEPGVRIKVEVLNASGERGLARRAMHYLRERGFDVVSLGTAKGKLDSSLVIDRSGHPAWAAQAVRAIGAARVQTRADSARYLDLTLVLGASFRPPSLILYP